MKKIAIAALAAAAIFTATSAQADWQHRRPRAHYNGGRGGNWVAPLIGGAIIGGILANQYSPQPRYDYYNQPRVVCRDIENVDPYGNYYWTHKCWEQ